MLALQLDSQWQKAVHHKLRTYSGRQILLLLSGGSALSLLDAIPDSLLAPQTTISTLDERFTREQENSNFAQITHTPFYSKTQENGCSFYDAQPKDDETSTDTGERFDSFLKDWRKKNPEGKIVITQGVGEDGHTAGIFPAPHDETGFTKRFLDPMILAVGYSSPLANVCHERITVTFPFLTDAVDTSIVMLIGEKKRKAFEIITGKGSVPLSLAPASIIPRMKEVLLITDLT